MTGQDRILLFCSCGAERRIGACGLKLRAVQVSGEDMRTVRTERGKPRMEKRLQNGIWRRRRDYAMRWIFKRVRIWAGARLTGLHLDGHLQKLLVSVSVDMTESNAPCVNLFFANQQCGQLSR